MEKQFDVTIADRKLIAEDTYEMSFDFGNIPFSFSAGQYVWIKLPKLNYPDERGEVRAFSVASSPNIKNQVTIVFRKSESGFKKTLLETPIGSKVVLSGPFGSRLLPSDSSRPIIFVAGGVGIAPTRSMIKSALENKYKPEIYLIYSNNKPERAVYLDELSTLKAKNPNFSYDSIIGNIAFGFIEDVIKKFKTPIWYITGPKEMVRAVTRILFEQKVPEEDIRLEEFYFSPETILEELVFPEKEPEEKLLELEKFKLAVENSTDHIIITDPDGVIQFANKAAEVITGYKISEMVGQTPRLWGGLMDGEFYKNLWKTIKYDRTSFTGEITNRRKTGETYLALTKIAPVLNSKSVLVGFVGTEDDITKEREIDRAKTEFVALASHQLKTPLSAINWSIEGLLDDKKAKLTEKQTKTLKDVYKMSQQMGDLVITLLDISKIQLGTFVIELKETDISAICDEVLKSLEVKIESNKTKVGRKYPDKFIVQTDPRLVKIIIQNLISNAVKYGKSEGEIVVGFEKSDSQVLIQVSNEGNPIPIEEQPRVFERFFRTAEVKGIEGTGLGLYMTKEIVEKLGGKIWFKSSPNTGTTFYVSLPAKTD